MSSSSNPAVKPAKESEIRPFPYAELPAAPGADAGVVLEHNKRISAGGDQSLSGQDAVRAQKENAVAAGERQQWEEQLRAGFDRRLQETRESVRATIADFAHQRAQYFHEVEAEVVQLALGITRKILRRETQIDPLLLAGMVRVALERIESGTKVTVRVHPPQVSECRAYFAQHLDAAAVPEVVEDASLPVDHCILQTVLGTTELGPEVQLKEIEQGLLDLLERRPRAAP